MPEDVPLMEQTLGHSRRFLQVCYRECVRTPPPVNLPEGGTPAERLDMAFRKVLTVSKADILKAEGQEKRDRERRKRAKKPN
jgi:hypothetical protein